MIPFVQLHHTKKGKTHVLEWRLFAEGEGAAPVRLPLPFRPELPGPPSFTVEMLLTYLFLWGLRGEGPVYVQHQEWDLERPDPAGYSWHRPQAEVARFLERLPARRVEWELTGRIVGGRGPLAVRAWWDPHPVLLAAPPRWEPLLAELANSAGRDAAARTAWFFPTSPQTTLDEMARAINDRLEPGQPPWPLPRGCALLAYAEHGQDEGYRSAVQFTCKNASTRDRVMAAARDFNQWLDELAACRSSQEFLARVNHRAAIYTGPAAPGAQAGPGEEEPEGEGDG